MSHNFAQSFDIKYRKPVLVENVGVRLRELVREVCRTNEIEIFQDWPHAQNNRCKPAKWLTAFA